MPSRIVNGKLQHPVHRCPQCTLMVNYVADVTCDNCIDNTRTKLDAPNTCYRSEFHPWGCYCPERGLA